MARSTRVSRSLWIDGERRARTVRLWTVQQELCRPRNVPGRQREHILPVGHSQQRDGDLRDGKPPMRVQNVTPKRYPEVNLGDFSVRGVEIDGRLMVNGTGRSFPYLTPRGNVIIVPHGLPEIINTRLLPMQQDGVVFIAPQKFRDKARGA